MYSHQLPTTVMIPNQRDRRRPAARSPEPIIVSQPMQQRPPEAVILHRRRSRSPSPIRIQSMVPVYSSAPGPRPEVHVRTPDTYHQRRPRSRSRSPIRIHDVDPVYNSAPITRPEVHRRTPDAYYQLRPRSRSRSPIRIHDVDHVYNSAPETRPEAHRRTPDAYYQRRPRSRSPPIVVIPQPAYDWASMPPPAPMYDRIPIPPSYGQAPMPSAQFNDMAPPPPPPIFYPGLHRSYSSGSQDRRHGGSYSYPTQQPIIVNEDPYVPVDPFQLRPQQTVNIGTGDIPAEGDNEAGTSVCLPFPICCSPEYCFACATWISDILIFFLEDLPRQVYLHLLLRIPSLYFSRVTRVFEDAELSMPDIKRMVNREENDVLHANWPSHSRNRTHLSPALSRFKGSWEDFIVSLSTEWQTQNIIAVLLLSAVLTLLQIDSIGDDPLSRTAAILALLCALMSLLYGCVYMVRFGTMNKMYKAASWAVEAQRTRTFIFWNVWVFLSMPTVWLSWSLILFITCIMSFVWRTTTSSDPSGPPTLTHRQILGLRIAITAVLGLGFLYFLLIMKTLKHYGSDMDKEWKDRAMLWQKEGRYSSRAPRDRDPPDSDSSTYPRLSEDPTSRGFAPVVLPSNHNKVLPQLDFKPMKILDLDTLAVQMTPVPWILCQQDVIEENWHAFVQNIAMAWNGVLDVPNVGVHQRLQRRQEIVTSVVDNWNSFFFFKRGVKVLYSDDINLKRERDFFSQLNSTGASVSSHSLYMISLPPVKHDPTGLLRSGSYVNGVSSHSSPTDPQNKNSIVLNSRSPHPTSTQAPTVPGPYSAALQQAQTTPTAFSRKITTFENLTLVETGKILDLARPVRETPLPQFIAARSVISEDWERFVIDLTYGWQCKIPVSNLTHGDCMAIRPTILADLITTWNTRFFHSRGVEAFLTARGTDVFDDGSPFYTPSVLYFRSFDPGPKGINGHNTPSSFRSVLPSSQSTPDALTVYAGPTKVESDLDRPSRTETSRTQSERKPESSRGTFNQRARGRLLRRQKEMSN